MAESFPVAAAPARTEARAALAAMRPRQWTKNLLLFAGIVFAAQTDDPGRWRDAVLAFAAFALASSAAYLVNDVRDAADDRLHPVKRRRPVASGALSPATAGRLAAVLALVAAGLAVATGWDTLACLAGFLAVQAAYTLFLRHVVLVDVIAIAGLFVLRAAAGAVAVDVRISPWLLLCTGLLALFLALGKRRCELVLVGASTTPGRPVLAGYSLPLVDRLIAVVAASTVAAYALYALTARDGTALTATVPLVVFGLCRYLLLLHREQSGEEPDQVLVTDAPILLAVAAWALACGTILGLT